MIKSVAIILCDNDFWATFRPLLLHVREIILYPRDKEGLSKENITKIILDGIQWHYVSYQYQYVKYGPHDMQKTVNYLKENIEVLFDEEADRAPFELDHDCGSWYIHIETAQLTEF